MRGRPKLQRGAAQMREALSHHLPRRTADGRALATRQGAAVLVGRHPDLVSRHCEPVACDAGTGLPLYDLAAVEAALAQRRRVAV